MPPILDLVEQCCTRAQREIPSALKLELALAIDTLLDAEDIGAIEPLWGLVERDARVAVAFREMLTRRRRWALDFDGQFKVFRRRLIEGCTALLENLPAACLEREGNGSTSALTTPLSSLLESPAETIEQLVLCAYDDAVFSRDLFKQLRDHFAGRLLVASGFAPDTDPHLVSDKLILPTRHKTQNASALAELYLGGTPFEAVLDYQLPFEVPEAARFEHCHIVGGTGHGKTQLLQKLIHADLLASREDGRSVVVIDSQGDLVQKLIHLDLFDPTKPDSLADRLVIIDPADVEYPPSLNLFDAPAGRFETYRSAERERALNGLIELYETFFGALLGAELTQKQGVIFRYLARLMLAIPGATIHTLMQLMEDSRPFRAHMEKLDGSARYFFETEFSHPSFNATKKQILKRLWGVLSTPAFERMFAQASNKLDLFDAINGGKIILINTAKDLLKTEGSALFGRFFIAMLAQAALERSILPDHARNPTFVYVDEAQEYFDESIETILSQARKYRVGMTLAHQTLDQLSPRLRAAFLANTSFKCAGGVSARDARALADELRTSASFIEGMRKRSQHSEFAAWVKHVTPSALRLDVPLGHLERQATIEDEAFELLLERNRALYCGTLDEVLAFAPPAAPKPPPSTRPARSESKSAVAHAPDLPPSAQHPPENFDPSIPAPAPPPPPEHQDPLPHANVAPPPSPPRELGKGGPKHRYLQALVKGLAEAQGFRVTIEAPVAEGSGQIDVLLEREGVAVAIEISVTTPVAQEIANVRKCLEANIPRIGVILAKSKSVTARYRAAILASLTPAERERVSLLVPEEVPDFIAALGPAPEPSEMMVRGYRVRVSHTPTSPNDTRARRDRIAKLVARSLDREG